MNVIRLNEALDKSGTTKQDLARRMGINRSTLYRKLKNGCFTIGQAQDISSILSLTKKEALDIFLPLKSHKCDESRLNETR